jgi:hypothetical protein
VFEWKQGKMRMLSPRSIEEMMVAVGLKETNANIEILITTEVFADLCFRLVRLESVQCPCSYLDEQEGEDYD